MQRYDFYKTDAFKCINSKKITITVMSSPVNTKLNQIVATFRHVLLWSSSLNTVQTDQIIQKHVIL